MTGCGKSKGSDAPPPPPPPPTSGTDYAATAFPGEVAPPASLPCALGAYYRKLNSSQDYWLGITGTVVLPFTAFDSTRTRPTNPRQFLDNPSMYMGGNASNQETDIGMTWEVIRDAAGNVTPDRQAFRPFLRRTGFAASGQQATYINAPAIPSYYWYPGDTVTMTVKIVSNGVLQLTVESRNKKFDTTFAADGFRLGTMASFKRVNAIDQVSNEGRPVQPSKTKVTGAKWLKTSLFRAFNGATVEAPMHSNRRTPMLCPEPKYFLIQATDEELKKGAEAITIDADK